MISKRVAYKVKCAGCEKFFDKVFNIQEGSEEIPSEVEAYCPHCDQQVTVTVQGKLVPDKDILRKFNLPKNPPQN